METIHKFTREQLIEAFIQWNKDFDLNPEDFEDQLNAEKQAEALIKYLNVPKLKA